MLLTVLAIEQEPIRLAEIKSETQVPEGRSVLLLDRRKVIIPHRFALHWDQVRAGASLYSLALRSRASAEGMQVGMSNTGSSGPSGGGLFREVARFLHFLVDNDLVDDLRLVRLSDAIRGEFTWPDAFYRFFQSDRTLALWGRTATMRFAFAKTLDVALALLTAIAILGTATLSIYLWSKPSIALTRSPFDSWSLLIGFFAAGVIARSIASILRAFASFCIGDSGELGWCLDLVGPHLTFRPHSVTGPYRRAYDFLMAPGAILVSFVLALIAFSFGGWQSLVEGLLVGGTFAAAMAMHPYLRSELTQSLKVWNRSPLAWRENEELEEVESFHRIGRSLSLGFFSFAALGLVAWYVHFMRGPLQMGHLFGAFVVFFSFYSYLEPYFSGPALGSERKRKVNLRRRLWATKPNILHLAAKDRELWNELPVLRQLTPPVRSQLMEEARVISVREGHAVCRQGAVDRSLFIVLEGELAVAKSFESRRRKVVAKLTGGAVFGETAFFFGVPRSADVVALTDARLLEIPYRESMKGLDIHSSEEFQFRVWLLQALSGQGFLKELPSEAMDTLIFAGERKKFRIGETIFTEGSPGVACYFIAQGRAAAIKGGQKIREMGVGDAFGEIALLNPRLARTATVVAESDLLCMELNIENFWNLLSARLPLGVEIERLALQRLADDQRRFLEQR